MRNCAQAVIILTAAVALGFQTTVALAACSDGDSAKLTEIGEGSSISLIQPIDLEGCGDKTSAYIRYSGGKWMCAEGDQVSGWWTAFTMLWRRGMTMTVQKNSPSNISRTGTCYFSVKGGDFWINRDRVIDTGSCVINNISFGRAVMDQFRSAGKMTVGSLKYNLGPKFKVNIVCPAEATQNNQVSKGFFKNVGKIVGDLQKQEKENKTGSKTSPAQ